MFSCLSSLRLGPHLTCTSDQDFGVAAGEAVEQGLGPDVAVEEGGRASQLGQSEPDPHELGLVSHEESRRVPLAQVGVGGQGPGHLAALPVRLPVGVRALLEDDERLVRMPGDFVQETVHDAVEGFALQQPLYAKADFNGGDRETEVLEEVRVPPVEQQQQQNRQAYERGV